jgi:cysteine sulfinate desulfinase/cysteine desulfurase-like protein
LHGIVRFSLDRDTSEADIARVLGVLPGIVGDLRGDRGADRGSAASLHDAA